VTKLSDNAVEGAAGTHRRRARPLIRRLAHASSGVYLLHLLLLQAALTWVVGPSVSDPFAAVALIAVSGTVVVVSFILSLLRGKLGWRGFLG
jgi:peptidoglycan/LPS O-acetylase OafA/YrhL